jgi:hypothetical protein
MIAMAHNSVLQSMCREAERVRIRAAQLLDQQSRCHGPALRRRLQEELDQLLARREELARIAALLQPTSDPLLWSLFREITRRPVSPAVI